MWPGFYRRKSFCGGMWRYISACHTPVTSLLTDGNCYNLKVPTIFIGSSQAWFFTTCWRSGLAKKCLQLELSGLFVSSFEFLSASPRRINTSRICHIQLKSMLQCPCDLLQDTHTWSRNLCTAAFDAMQLYSLEADHSRSAPWVQGSHRTHFRHAAKWSGKMGQEKCQQMSAQLFTNNYPWGKRYSNKNTSVS